MVNLLFNFLIYSRTIFLVLKRFKLKANFQNIKIKNNLIIIKSFPIKYWIAYENIVANELINKGFQVIILIHERDRIKYNSFHYNQGIYLISVDSYISFFDFNKPQKFENIGSLKKYFYQKFHLGNLILGSLKNVVLNSKFSFDKKWNIKLNLLLNLSIKYLNGYKKIINEFKPILIIAVEKGDIGSGELYEIAIENKIDFVQWSNCHQPQSLMLKRYSIKNKNAHPFSVSKESLYKFNFDNIKIADEVFKYFHNGYINGAWFSYKKLLDSKIIYTREDFSNKFELDPLKKNIVIFSHVLNDANFFYGEDLFEGGFADWLAQTINIASGITNVNWIVKLHPANVYRNKNLGILNKNLELDLIKESLGSIPDNILFLSSDCNINPYSFFNIADVGITVRGTIGAELPCFGIPVITAGTGRYSDLGFTLDPKTKDEYFNILSNINLLKKLDEKSIALAQKHAYLFFKSRVFDYSSILYDNIGETSLSEHNIQVIDKNFNNTLIFQKLIDFLTIEKNEDFVH